MLAAQAAAETGAGCRLAEDPQQWMDGGTWKGIMHEMIWDEDGEILALRPRPAAWHPPPPRPDYRCVGRPCGQPVHCTGSRVYIPCLAHPQDPCLDT